MVNNTEVRNRNHPTGSSADRRTRSRGGTQFRSGAATRNHQGAVFVGGKLVGAAYSIGLAFVNPCGATALVSWGIKGLNAVQAAGNSINAYGTGRRASTSRRG
jgi:hypothetical protein